MPQEDLYDLIEERPLSAILPQRNNLNKHTQRGMGMLENSIQKVGWIGAGTMAANGEIFDGTARHEKADILDANALIVKTDGTRPVYVMRTDIPTADDPRAIEAGLRANRVAEVNLSWDTEALIELNNEGLIEIDEFWLPQEQEMLLVDTEEGDGGDSRPSGERTDADDEEQPPGAPNDLFPSSNEWGIPELDPAMQPDTIDIDWLKWGVKQRTGRHEGGIHFYTDDYKFNGTWAKPDDLLATGCGMAIEPNFSTWANMPRALALTGIYKKRWLARYWQTHGVSIWIDVNVSPHLHDLNFLGVPKSWRYFATRYLASFDDGNVAGYDAVMADWNAIVAYTGTEDCVLLVYGGRPTTFKDRPIQWVLELEHSDSIRGNYSGQI